MKDKLAREGHLVMLRKCGSGTNWVSKQVELLVPEIEATEAHSIIMELVGTVRA
jgi:hypothetical protein